MIICNSCEGDKWIPGNIVDQLGPVLYALKSGAAPLLQWKPTLLQVILDSQKQCMESGRAGGSCFSLVGLSRLTIQDE